MKKIIISGLSGVVIGVLIAALLFWTHTPRPGPTAVTEVSQLGPDTVQEQSRGHLSGDIKRNREPAQIAPENISEGNYTRENDTPIKSQPVASETYRIPVTGEISTQYFYDGQKVGEGIHQIVGETIVTIAPDRVSADTVFEDVTNLRVDLPDPPQHLWHVGPDVTYTVGQGVGFGGHVQRDFVIATTKWGDVLALGRVEVGEKTKLTFGVEVSF